MKEEEKKKRISSFFRDHKTIKSIEIEKINFLENHDFLLE
jgi:hypothetical protein